MSSSGGPQPLTFDVWIFLKQPPRSTISDQECYRFPTSKLIPPQYLHFKLFLKPILTFGQRSIYVKMCKMENIYIFFKIIFFI